MWALAGTVLHLPASGEHSWIDFHTIEGELIYLGNAVFSMEASPDPIWRSKNPTGSIKAELHYLCGTGKDTDKN